MLKINEREGILDCGLECFFFTLSKKVQFVWQIFKRYWLNVKRSMQLSKRFQVFKTLSSLYHRVTTVWIISLLRRKHVLCSWMRPLNLWMWMMTADCLMMSPIAPLMI